MLRIIFVITVMLQFSNASAQRYFRDFLDSVVAADHFSEKDWAIAIYNEHGGSVPIYDSLGNVIFDEPELFATIVVYNINNIIYLQRFKQECYGEDTCFHAGTRVQLPRSISINYTVDSIKQAEKEWVYQYIYKNEDDGSYVYQEDSGHSPHYVMTFFTRQLNTWKNFTKICFEERVMQHESWPKNLNYKVNINTFTYRAFLVIERFVVNNRKWIPND